MTEAFIGALREHPEVTFFLVLGIGYVLGKLELVGRFLVNHSFMRPGLVTTISATLIALLLSRLLMS